MSLTQPVESQHTGDRPSVFVSYVHDSESRRIARQVADVLEHHGLRVWNDEHEIEPGNPIDLKIDEAINDANAVLIILTEASAQSSWMSFEVAAAVVAKNQDPNKLIVPVFVPDADSVEVPPLLRPYKGIFISDKDPKAAAEQLQQLALRIRNRPRTTDASKSWDQVVDVMGVEAVQLAAQRQIEHRIALERDLAATARLSLFLTFAFGVVALLVSAFLATQDQQLIAGATAISPALAIVLILRNLRKHD